MTDGDVAAAERATHDDDYGDDRQRIRDIALRVSGAENELKELLYRNGGNGDLSSYQIRELDKARGVLSRLARDIWNATYQAK